MQRLFPLLLAAVAAPALAQAPAAFTPQIDVQTLKDVTRVLSSDAYEGRQPTTPAEAKTVAYITERFQRAGLQPGNKGSWTQDVPMVRITPARAPTLAFAGAGASPLTLTSKTDFALFTYRQAPAVDVAASDVVFVGYGVNAPEVGWNDYAGQDVRGKTVVILINDPDWQTKTLDGPFGGRAMTYYGRWTYKYEEAARQGAAAAIIVHDTEPAAYPWGVVVSSNTASKIYLDDPAKAAQQTQANGWMTLDAARRLFAAGGQDFDRLRAAAASKGFRAVPLGLQARFSLANTLEHSISHNVVGMLSGTTRANEAVLYTAHWDHLGRCEAVRGDNICNGAVDNASGVAGLVALAEAEAKAGRIPRTQLFLAVTAEEQGLLGSQYYAEHPLFPLARTVGGVNMDGLNVTGPTRDVVVTGPGKSELDDYVARYAALGGRRVSPEPHPEKGYYYRSDHFSLAKLGVPMVDAGSGEDMVNGGPAAGRAAAEDYEVNRYHKPQDEYDPNWNWAGAVQDLVMYARIGRDLATSSAWPNWRPTAEFRAIRDKSRAGL